MKFSLWTEYGALNSKPVFSAFATSLYNAGHTVVYNDYKADVYVIWSVLWKGRMAQNRELYHTAQQRGIHVIVLEVGILNRNVTWRVGLDGINNNAYFAPKQQTSERAKMLGLQLADWKEGEHILICCQHSKSEQWNGKPSTIDWLASITKNIRKYSKRTIIIRPHPREPIKFETKDCTIIVQQPKKIEGTYDSFDLSFDNIHAVVNLSSGPAVHAVIQGIPVFVEQASLAYPVGNVDISKIENPLKPSRHQWLNDLAHTEYTIEEIEEGIPLAHLTPMLI